MPTLTRSLLVLLVAAVRPPYGSRVGTRRRQQIVEVAGREEELFYLLGMNLASIFVWLGRLVTSVVVCAQL